MRSRPTRTIDLSKFGQTGVLTLAKPGYTQRSRASDAISNATVSCEDGKAIMKTPNLSMLENIEMISYIRDAPFDISYKGFFDYLDKMDEDDFGSAEDLVAEIKKAVKEIKEEGSPLPDSP